MPKIRGIKPSFFTDEDMVELSPLARLLYLGMWCHACDHGHIEDKPRQLKLRILPADECDVPALLAELVALGKVERGNGWLTIPTLTEHQRVDKRYFLTCDYPGCKDDKPTLGTRREAPPEPDECPPEPDEAPTLHDVHPTGTRRGHDGATRSPSTDGDGDGDGDGDSLAAQKRGSRIAEGWQPTEALTVWGKENAPHVDLAVETANFVDYWATKTGRDATKLDWGRTWQRWMRNAESRVPAWKRNPRSNMTEWEKGFTPTLPRVVGGTEWEQ